MVARCTQYYSVFTIYLYILMIKFYINKGINIGRQHFRFSEIFGFRNMQIRNRGSALDNTENFFSVMRK
jgi:hypothetical protein